MCVLSVLYNKINAERQVQAKIVCEINKYNVVDMDIIEL